MHDEFELHAAWLPGTLIRLGDVGTVDESNKFVRRTSLKNLGISFDTLDGNPGMDYQFTSRRGVSVDAKAAGQASIGTLKVADAGFSVRFSREKSTVFFANNVVEKTIDDLDSLTSDIASLYKKEGTTWKDTYVVVTKVICPESATILISRDSDASIDLKAEAQVPHMNIASIDANFSVQSQAGLHTAIVATDRLTPLFEIAEFNLEDGLGAAFGLPTKGPKATESVSDGTRSFDAPLRMGPAVAPTGERASLRSVPFIDRRQRTDPRGD
ncbi:MAG: hypothetical protein ABFC89_07755 [Methanospirillum sp.]